MPRKPLKTASVAFKIEADLAELLNQLPNRSAFIRKAVLSQLGVACPVCLGRGAVARALHDHYAARLPALRTRPCDGCGRALELPADDGGLAPEADGRLGQFFRGGPLYCAGCYRKAPACRGCGWRVTGGQAGRCRCPGHPDEDVPEGRSRP
jgi:hypothetical protein